ncbi:MAG: class I tRNA ligase family protein, partial [Candidatus Dormibacteraeota bacterium]|nr:class I tRNA ligase family protein [Candidatus Dormibacteraeota bacterium]
FDEDRIRSYQLYANKLWNVARYILGATEGTALPGVDQLPPDSLQAVDRWLLSRLDGLVSRVTRGIDGYRPGDAITGIYDFTWHDLADRYIEAIKPRLQLESADAARVAAASVAVHALDRVVRLLHPFMPYVTEAIWERLTDGRPPLTARAAQSVWPLPDGWADAALETGAEAVFELVRRLRDARKDMGISDRERVPAVLRGSVGGNLPEADARALLAALARLELVDELPGAPGREVVGDGVEISLGAPATGAGGDRAALERELKEAQANIERLEHQLANDAFVARANPAVVKRAREQLDAAREKRTALEEAFSRAK